MLFILIVFTCGQAFVAKWTCVHLSALLSEKSISASRDTTAWTTAWDWFWISRSPVFLNFSRSTLAGSAAIAPLRSWTPTSSTSLRRGNVTVCDSASKRDAGQPLADSDDSLNARNSTLAGSGAFRSTLDRWRRRRLGQRCSRSAKNTALGPVLWSLPETTHYKEQLSSNNAVFARCWLK